MKLYALLVGINDYPGNPLSGCENDVLKIEDHLNTLDQFESKDILILPKGGTKATKEEISKAITDHLGTAGDDDVAFFYFSGHGGQEKTNGRFPTEHDGALECLVCHYEEDQESGFLLADKEIRFLLSQFKNAPHLVTAFDCCHSGDMVRGAAENEEEEMVKRMSGFFDARPYSEFLFSDLLPEEKLQKQGLANAIPFKNHVHIAACGPSQLAWESSGGGVFTKYLIQLLKATNNQITYQEISRWAKISIKGITKKKQTPTFSVQGKGGKVHASSRWLGLTPDPEAQRGYIVYNKKDGWHYTRGALMGVTEGLKLEIRIDENESFNTSVISAGPETARIDLSLAQESKLKEKNRYEVIPETIYSPLNIFVNDLDQKEGTGQAGIKEMLEEYQNVQLTENPGAADYFVNIFNQTLYISLPEWEFRPLAEQIDLLQDERITVKDALFYQLNFVVKWHHFATLENPGKGFDAPPLKVEVQNLETQEWTGITNGVIDINPRPEPDAYGQLHQYVRLRITNTTNETLYVCALNLFSDFEINANLFDDQVVELKPGTTKLLYDHEPSGPDAYISIESYMDFYNWPWEFWNIVFIVNNFEDFTASIPDFVQPELKPPLQDGSIKRGGGPSKELKKVEERWGTIKTTLRLKNSNYNIISGELERGWSKYSQDEVIAPFIMQLYLEQKERGLYRHSISKPNNTGKDMNERFIGKLAMHTGNAIDNLRRLRIFRKAKINMPGKPVIIAEGDSWFLYPFILKDIIDYVMEDFPVRSIAAAGDELENYKNHGQLLQEIPVERPKYVLLSGGGNDIIGEEIKDILIKNIPAGQPPQAYLNGEFQKRLDNLKALYLYFFSELKKHNSVKQVLVHGYDYVRASNKKKILKKGWVNKYMKKAKIDDLGDRQRIINHLVDTFNEMLMQLCHDDPIATYINSRNKVGDNEWYDEIHPKNSGFKKIGKLFIDKLYDFEGPA